MSANPAFAATVRSELAQVSAANANRDGTGTLVDVLTAGANGSRIEEVDIIAIGTTTAGMIRLYWSDGVNNRLISEIAVTAITPSATVAAFSAEKADGVFPLLLKSGQKLKASTHNGETFSILAQGGDF